MSLSLTPSVRRGNQNAPSLTPSVRRGNQMSLSLTPSVRRGLGGGYAAKPLTEGGGISVFSSLRECFARWGKLKRLPLP